MSAVKSILAGLGALVFSCLPAAAWAKTPAPVPSPQQVAQASPRPLMWVIRDHDSTIYLFGSIHAMRDGVDWLTPDIRQRLDESGELWLEIADIDDMAKMGDIARKYMLNPANNMTAGLTEEEMRELDRRLSRYGLNSQMLMGMHKWAVGLILVQRQLAEMGLESDNGIDVTLLRRARVSGKPVKGFETIDQQMQILAPATDEADTEALRMTLKEMDETPAMIDALITGWLNGDTATLEQYLVDKVKAEDPEGYQRYIAGRNAAWAPQIEHLLDGKGTVFIAVGTAHLVGPDSVIALLKKDGIKAEAVSTAP